MRAGRMDRRVVLLRRQREQLASGEVVETWVDERAFWAEVIPLGAAERLEAATTKAVRSARFRTHFAASWRPVPADHRLRFDGLVWDVVGIAEVGRSEGWEISAEAHDRVEQVT